MSSSSHKNKPGNTLFKQQRLASWQPIMSPPHVTACFVLVAAIFIPIGIAIYSANSKVIDIEYRYDNIYPGGCNPNNNDKLFTYNVDNMTTDMGCRVTVSFDIPEQMEPPIYMYYGLKNFYQNHRTYAKSRNEKQLAGSLITSDSDLYDCRPLRHPGENLLSLQYGTGKALTVNEKSFTYDNMIYEPGGLVAWSQFNDSFTLYKVANASYNELICNTAAFNKTTSEPLMVPKTLPASIGLYDWNGTTSPSSWEWPCHKQGIAWESDREVKFKTPALAENIWSAERSTYYGVQSVTSDDPFFASGWYAGELGHQLPVNTDEDLMVWMRTSALPDFRKLFRVIDAPLPAGKYAMEIIEQYDVASFEGEKYFALATVSWVGGKNRFLGEAYIAVGAVALVAGLVFFIVHKVLGDRTQKAIESLNDLQ